MSRAPLAIGARPLRLASGLVMLVYLTLHLVSHALGLVSLAAAEAMLEFTVRLWHGLVGTALLYGAFALHFALALRTIFQRRHWKLPAIEWVRLWSGFGLPLLLIGHAVSTRVAASVYGLEPTYHRVIDGLVRAGSEGWQIALLAPGWLHGCLGLWLTLRHRPAIRRLWPLGLVLLIAVPVLSAGGFLAMRSEVTALALPRSGASPSEALALWRHVLLGAYVALVVGTFAAGRIIDHRRSRADVARL